MLLGSYSNNKYLQSVLSNFSLVLFALLTDTNSIVLAWILFLEVFLGIGGGILKQAFHMPKFNFSKLFIYSWVMILLLLSIIYYINGIKIFTIQYAIGLIIFINWLYKTLRNNLSAKEIELGRPFLGFIVYVIGATYLQNLNSNNLLLLWYFISLTLVNFVIIRIYKNKTDVPTII